MIYLDHHATTPLAPEVREAMQPFLADAFANPAAGYRIAQGPRRAVAEARDAVAALLGGQHMHWTFTSGATEALAVVIGGLAHAKPERRHLVVSALEHPAVREPCRFLAALGYEITVVPVEPSGRVDAERMRAAIQPGQTLLVALMHANNETGVLQPVEELATTAANADDDVAILCDASQSAGKVAVDVAALGVDVLVVSAHKFHGPKGVGAFYLRPGRAFHSPLAGGGHQRGRRGGTENVAGIVGLGVACTLAKQHLAQDTFSRVAQLRDQLQRDLQEAAPQARVNGAEAPRLPTALSVSFPHLHADALTQRLDDHGICVAAAAACHTNTGEPSETLQAMQVPETHIRGTLRISLGRHTTAQDITTTSSRLLAILAEQPAVRA